MLPGVAAGNLSELPSWAGEMLTQARVAHLGLLDFEGRPRVLPVTFALAEGRIWSAVDEKPKRVPPEKLARVRFLRRNPRAALTADRYSDDWTQLAWVQVLGDVEILEAAGAPGGVASLSEKYMPYRDAPPNGLLLALKPQRWLCWRASERHAVRDD
jgi:PPOX class probable F420-dependent enzyme